MSFSCPNCGCPATSSAMTAQQGLVKKCRDCGLIIPRESKLAAPPTAAAVQPQSPVVAASTPVAVKPEPQAKTLLFTPATVLRCTRKRVVELRRTIAKTEKQLARDKRELAELSRLLDAAKAQPRAVVRPIRTTA